MVRAEVTRLRCRPIVGRLPVLLGPSITVSTWAAFASGISLHSAQQLRAVSGTMGMALVVLAFAVGGVTVQDGFTSGMTATDHALLGRRHAELAAQQLAAGCWAAAIAVVVQLSLAAGFVLGHLSQGGAPITAHAWLRATVTAMPRLALASLLAASLGTAAVQLTRSAPAAIGALLTALLVLDGAIVAAVPAAVPLLLADHLLATAKGSTIGLADGAWTGGTASIAAVLGVVVVGLAALGIEGRRDLL